MHNNKWATAKIIKADWYPDKKRLVTQLKSELQAGDIEKRERTFRGAPAQMQDDPVGKVFVSRHGLKAVDLAAHKRFRDIVPLTPADYGWKAGYVNFFEGVGTMAFQNTGGK
jgi:hypothetical protein